MEFKRTSEGRVFFTGSKTSYKDHANEQDHKPILKSPLTGKILNENQQRETARARAADQSPSQYQVLSLLKSLNEKLKVTQIERNSMRQELKAYRRLITGLEEKAQQSTKDYEALQKELQKTQGAPSDVPETILNDLKQTQKLYEKLENRTERNDRQLTDLLEKAEAHKQASLTISKKQAELDRLHTNYAQLNSRIEKTEDQYNQLSKALTTQTGTQGLNDERLLELISQDREDRARFMRKMEKLEKTVLMLADQNQAKPQIDIAAQATPQPSAQTDIPRYLLQTPAQHTAPVKKSSAQWVKNLATQINDPWEKLMTHKVPHFAAGFLLLTTAAWGLYNSNIIDRIQNARQQAELNKVAAQIEQLYMPPATQSATQAIASAQTTTDYNAANSWEVSKDISQFMIKPDTAQNPNLPSEAQQQQLETLMETAPEQAAEALNQIQPGSITAPAIEIPAPQDKAAKSAETKAPTDLGALDPRLPESLASLQEMAQNGDHNAQHDLAALYVIGQNNVPQDYKRAAYWFDKAAQGGVANATYNMGVLYHQGLGLTANLDQAVSWYKAAADQGHPEAAYNLGIAYIEGIGVDYDPYKATIHFEKAALSGTVEAAYNLGLIYENGLLGKAEPGIALMWYKIAADNNLAEAQNALTQLINALGISYSELGKIVQDVRKNYPAFQAISEQSAENASRESNQAVSTPSHSDDLFSADLREDVLAAEQQTKLIKIAQQKLMDLKLYPGPVDGAAGPKTTDGILAYQKAYNLPETGEITASLIEHMQN